jgi:cytochrome P450
MLELQVFPSVLAVAFALLLVWQLLPPKASKHQKLFQPASTLPILGNTLDLMWFQKHRLHDWMREQSLASGGKPWLLTVVGQLPRVVLSSPEAYEDVFKTQFDVFVRGPGETVKEVLGEGIFNVDGDKWKHQRRVTSHLFSMHMLKDCMNAVIREKTVKLRDVLAKCAERGDVVSIKSLLNKFTADTFTRIGFGVEANGLDDPVEVECKQPLDAALQVVQVRLQSPVWLWKLRRLLNIGSERVMRESMQQVNDTIEQIVAKSLDNKQKAKSGVDSSHKDLMTLMLQSGDFTDVREIHDVAVDFYAAGKDTSAFSLSWFIVMMNRHPHVLGKVREELRGVVPDLFTGELDAPTQEHLQQLTYLEAALRESLRLNALAVYRLANRDTTLSDGTFVPKGARVVFSMFASARQPTVWGPDAAEYKPERWLYEEKDKETTVKLKLKTVSSFKFVTFSAGPRQCIGMRLAMMEMMTVLAVVFSRFDLVTVDDPFDITYDFSLVLPVKGPLAVRVRSLAAHVA